jgi:uncharacterized MAPEG superfamily protein
MAQLAGVNEGRIAALAIVFIALRLVHGVVYTLGWPHFMRSLAWLGAILCVFALMAMAAVRLGSMS